MPKVTAVVEVADISLNPVSELSEDVQPSVWPAGTGVTKVRVQVLTTVPVNMMLPWESLPELLLVVPQEDTVGFRPEVTTCPVVSISKLGTPTVAVVEPTENAALVEYVLPTPRNGLEAVVSTLNTSEPAAFDTEKAWTLFVRDCIARLPSGVVVPTPTNPLAAKNKLLVAVSVFDAEK